MKWVILTDDYPPQIGGVATWTERIASGLMERGEEVLVFARYRYDRDRLAPGVFGIRGPSYGRYGPWWLALQMWWKIQPGDQVIATTWSQASGLLWRIKQVGATLHVVFHGSDLTSPPRDRHPFNKVCLHASHRWVVSKYLQGVLSTYGFESEVLPAPVNISSTTHRDYVEEESCQTWAYIARATPLKGGERFLDILSLSDAKGRIAGDGPSLAAWKDYSVRKGVGDRVEFLGDLAQKDVSQVMAASSLVFLLPKEGPSNVGTEGLGLTLLEAAALGVPGVGCRTGGVPESIGLGLLLTHPDHPDTSLVEIREWLHRSRGEACKEWVEAHHGTDKAIHALRTAGNL